MDDVVVYSDRWEDHVRHLREVLERLREAGLTAKPSKCQLGMSHYYYLGYMVGGGVVKPDQGKVDVMKELPTPQTKKQVLAFLGLGGYYKKFIPGYSVVAAELTDLVRKNRSVKVVWTEECEKAFRILKEALAKGPVLRSPYYDRSFLVQTDASDCGMGAVLSQMDKDGCDHLVAYYSRKFLPREEHYATVEECLAVKLGIKAF